MIELFLGCGLIDHIFRSQIDIVTGPNRVKKTGLMNLDMLRGQDCQQSLNNKKYIFVVHCTVTIKRLKKD